MWTHNSRIEYMQKNKNPVYTCIENTFKVLHALQNDNNLKNMQNICWETAKKYLFHKLSKIRKRQTNRKNEQFWADVWTLSP